jgi:hypothetical protein
MVEFAAPRFRHGTGRDSKPPPPARRNPIHLRLAGELGVILRVEAFPEMHPEEQSEDRVFPWDTQYKIDGRNAPAGSL